MEEECKWGWRKSAPVPGILEDVPKVHVLSAKAATHPSLGQRPRNSDMK